MPDQTRIVAPGPRDGTVRLEDGRITEPPSSWELLPPGDAGLTRRVKKDGPTWTVMVERRRRKMSQGVWAPADVIARHRTDLAAERSTASHAKKRAADARRREAKQSAYVVEFRAAVYRFLDFHLVHHDLAVALAEAVARHATPVGSGTVARTERIPVEQRAEAAVIAWLRHETTGYDGMKIARVKGRRREVRRRLAERSRELLEGYRRGETPSPHCPLGAVFEGGASESWR